MAHVRDEGELVQVAVALARLHGVSYQRYEAHTGSRYAWEPVVAAVWEALGEQELEETLGERRWGVFDRVYAGMYGVDERPWGRNGMIPKGPEWRGRGCTGSLSQK